MSNIISTEPVLAALTTMVVAVIAVLAAFGLAFTAAQSAAIVGLVAAGYGLFALVRKKVTPVADPKTEDGEPLVPESEVLGPDF